MPEWVVTRATAPEIIWARYAQAFGPEELRRTFGHHWPPARARVNEEVYVWRDRLLSPRPFDPADHPAAWLSLAPNQFDPSVAHMSRGVWPDQHHQGLGRQMRAFAEQWCRERAVTSLKIEVFTANIQHLTNVLMDTYWTLGGMLYDPPALLFTHQIAP